MSDSQRKELSNIIQGQSSKDDSNVKDGKLEISVKDNTEVSSPCCCSKQNIKLSDCDKIGSIVEQFMKSNKCGKATIMLEIEFNN